MDDDGPPLTGLLLDQRVGEVGDVGSHAGGGVLLGVVLILHLLGGALRVLGIYLGGQRTIRCRDFISRAHFTL